LQTWRISINIEFFQKIDMENIQALLQSLLAGLGELLPRALAALAILLGAWIIARIVKAAITRLAQRVELDRRLKTQGLSATFANLGYWVVWLFALPMLLGTLGLTALLEPVNAMMSQLFAFIPRLIGAVAVFAIGYLVANVIRQVITGLLTAAGSEKLAARLNMTGTLGKDGLAGMIGLVVFVLIMLPIIAAALQPLGLESISQPVTNMIETITALIPRLFGAAIILVLAVVLGRVLADIIARLLATAGVDKLPEKLGFGAGAIGGRTASEIAGTLVLAAIVLMALVQASDVLGFRLLTDAIAAFGVASAQIIAGLFVLAAGLWISNAAANAVRGSSLGNAGTLATLTRAVILFFTVPLALMQMGLPAEIITIGFGAIMLALAVAAAIAFGIGGRHAAGRMVDGALNRMQARDTNTDVTTPSGRA
jgi:hypothetical protein